jgi:DNA-binding transcriptional ArsR family regulator
MQIAKALADANRVRILLFLAQSELCLCQIIELLQLSPSTVSKHISILTHAGLVDVRKEGRWHYYRVPEAPEPEVTAAYDFLQNAGIDSAQIQLDRKRLRQVLKLDREKLCSHYKS